MSPLKFVVQLIKTQTGWKKPSVKEGEEKSYSPDNKDVPPATEQTSVECYSCNC